MTITINAPLTTSLNTCIIYFLFINEFLDTSSWELDSTEGPARIRNRLRRCHLKLKDKYLMTEFQDRLGIVLNLFSSHIIN